jgi:FMN phosphatase YigB (HAD superfamily)
MSNAPASEIVFLFDVDNTLLDNDLVKKDIRDAVAALVSADRAQRFWVLYEEVRGEEGVVDFPETLRRFRRAFRDEPRAADVVRAVLGLPFERYLYPRALDVIAHLWTLGEVAILSDGDRVYQPAKIARAGLLAATRGNVLVYEHKEDHLGEVQRRFPAAEYVHVDDKAALLSETKNALGSRATTVHVRQGHYASELPAGPRPDIAVDRIADLLTLDPARFAG